MKAKESPEKSLAERFREALFSEKHQTNSELARKLGKDEHTISTLKYLLKKKCVEEIKAHEDMSDEEKQVEIDKLDNDYFKAPPKPTLIPPEDEEVIEKSLQQTPQEVKPSAKQEFKSQLADEAAGIELGKKHIREEEKEIEELEGKVKPLKEYLEKLDRKEESSSEEIAAKEAFRKNIDGLGEVIELHKKALESYKSSTAQMEEFYRMQVIHMTERAKANMETSEEAYDYRTKTNLLKSQEDYEKALSRTNPAGEQSPQGQMGYLLDTLLKAKGLFNPSSLDDASKMMTFIDAVAKWATDRRPAQSPGDSIIYQPSSAEEYKTLMELKYRWSGKQSRDKMIESVISPLKDYLFQRFGFGIQPQGVQQMSPQQTMFQQQPMPTQPRQPVRPAQESPYEPPKPQAPQPPYEPPKPQAPQPQMAYVFRPLDEYKIACPVCGTPVDVTLDSISVNRCSRCGILVLAVEDSPGNAEYIRQMKLNQWTEELTDKIKLATQRFNEVTMTGLTLNTQPLVDKGKDASNDPLMGTFLAMAVREGIEKYLGGVSADVISSLVEKNVGIDTVWEMIPQGFKQSLAVYSSEHPKQLRYVLDPTWVMEAIRESNSSLAEYFTDHPLGKAWLEGIISGFRSKLRV